MHLDKSEQRIRRMFGEIAPRYDFLNHFLSAGTDFYWRWRTVQLVPPAGPAPILDVCTGTGDLALAYWKRGQAEIPVFGTDFAPEMLKRARTKLKRIPAGPPGRGPLFIEADSQHLPFAEDCFQIVSVAFGLRNITDPEQGLREMVRVCRPAGRVAVLEFSMPGNPVLGRLYGWYFRGILPRLGQWVSRNKQEAYRYLPASVGEFPQGEQLAALMQRCGLESVTWQPLTFGIATLYQGRKPTREGRGSPTETRAASLDTIEVTSANHE